jgi:hypothetical protein
MFGTATLSNDAISPYFFQTMLFCKNIFANRTISKNITLLALFSFFFQINNGSWEFAC